MWRFEIKKLCRKKLFVISALTMLTVLSFSSRSKAADFDYVKIYPEHVGIFTSVGQQQFVAFGFKAGQTPVNITRDVDWISSNEKIVTINESGVATVVSTYGQANISCSYPKKGGSEILLVPQLKLLLRE